MSEEKSYCKRCNKELVYCGYLSKVDKKLICSECFEKEQPKYLVDKITDLEAKLAEKEATITNLIEDSKASKELLKKQLAEKDKEKEKEIEEVKEWWACQYKANTERQDQDKISFALEKLTELKKWTDEMLNGWKTNQDVNQLTRDGICLSLENVGYKIDNQIKLLKEGK